MLARNLAESIWYDLSGRSLFGDCIDRIEDERPEGKEEILEEWADMFRDILRG